LFLAPPALLLAVDYSVLITVGGVALWLERRSLTGELSLMYT